ncbi:G/T mismatch-specific thymine DNA glycosylase-like [Tigriopus californicus]|uniref:G/T mismatch-specific thymine DNA glycosylase-like n=1 Tax=Tigriopus californicus TaxID=6832 RepID=UPI0027DA0F76|nr:G/T mismatch-specific thymine DNA glycosylase-like [Tigriopus californicus]
MNPSLTGGLAPPQALTLKKAAKRPKPASQAIPKTKSAKVPKRRVNRFNGMTEEEVALRGLPDYLREGLDIVFIGINPSLAAAYSGKYYDGPGNHFWQALFLSGLIDKPMGPHDDYKLMDMGIGFTNVCPRTTRGVADLSKAEIAAGAVVLKEKLLKYRPKIAVFNGKSIYQVYSESKKFMFGRQPEPLDHEGSTWIWVMPSSSARCAQLPRAVDKVPFFSALIKFRDFLHGKTAEPDEAEIVFANVVLKNAPRRPKVKVEQEEPPAEDSI